MGWKVVIISFLGALDHIYGEEPKEHRAGE